MRYIAAFLLLSASLFTKSILAQTPDAAIATKEWPAFWIAVPNSPGTSYGVYHFRKIINLATKPATFNIRISADNRYKFYVNGILVSLGPARGDTYYWNYEKVDIAPYLTFGKNTIAATVWNDGEYRPEAQISLRTAFIVQGDSAAEEILNTDTSWKCIRDTAYAPNNWIGYYTYYVAGPGEIIDMKHTVKGFTDTNFDDTKWLKAEELGHGKPKGMADAFGWMLVPSQIPQMERTVQRIPVLREADGMTIPASFPATKTAITIPANTTVTLLLDQTYLTSAYVTFNFSKGTDAGIAISYAESLFDNSKEYDKQKSNRNDIEGKYFAGRKDSLISDGTDGQSFNSLYWRTYRYIRLRVQTKNEPLTIDDIYGTFTGYPFKYNAVFNTSNDEIKKYWR